ncbi:MAG: hypothetical protein ACR2QV_02175, partial [Gammaproteobacteria bacterium]
GTNGRGDDAIATAIARNHGSTSVTATADATGGSGASSFSAEPSSHGSATATATGISTGDGTVTVTAIQRGGDMLFIGNVIPGAGAETHIINAVTGETRGDLNLVQEAYGGAGADAYNVDAGNGGAATSTLSVVDSAAAMLNATASAIGGTAGQGTHPDYLFGRGGDAVVEIDARGIAVVTATGNADGGESVGRFPDTGGRGGDARSSVIASSVGGPAEARANATSGQGIDTTPYGKAEASATANAGDSNAATALGTATGAFPTAAAEAGTSGGPVVSIVARSSAAVEATDGNDRVQLLARADAWIGDGPHHNTGHATAKAGALPSESFRDFMLNGNPIAQDALGSEASVALVGILGGLQPSNVSTTDPFTSILDISLTPSALTNSDLLIAFLDPVASGTGFDELRFQILEEENTVFDQTFVDVAHALAFFDDNVLNLGAWLAGEDGILDLRFRLDIISSGGSDGFTIDFLAGTAQIPIPAAIAMFPAGLIALLLFSRRRFA